MYTHCIQQKLVYNARLYTPHDHNSNNYFTFTVNLILLRLYIII